MHNETSTLAEKLAKFAKEIEALVTHADNADRRFREFQKASEQAIARQDAAGLAALQARNAISVKLAEIERAIKGQDCPCWKTGVFRRVEGCAGHPYDL